MPISQINPDGSVKIYNKETGQVLDVPPEDLPKYSGALVGDYQKLKTQQDGVRNAAKAVQAGQIKISDVPAEQKMGVINQITAGGGKIPEPVNAADQKKKSSAGPALNLIKNLESQYQSAGGGQVDVPILSRIVGAAKDIGGNLGFDDSANRYNATREGFAASLKQLTGDTGVLTDQDYARLSKLLPSLGAKPEEAKAAFNLLRSQLGSTLNQPATQTTINPQKKTLGDLAAPFVKPLADYGKFIGGAEYEGVRAAASALGDKNAYNEQIHTNPFLTHEDLAKYKNPVEGLKTTAGGVSYVVPFGKGANLLTKAVLPGAISGALSGVSRDDATPESVVQSAGLGAAGGVALNAVSKVAGMGPKSATGAGKDNVIRNAADLVSGGGSKEYVARAATNADAIPQNQVLLEKGILAKPTETGRIQAAAIAKNDFGSQLGKIYKNSDRVFKDGELGGALDTGLKDLGYHEKDIQFLKTYLNRQGNFDLASGDTLVTAETAWRAAQRLEQAPPKMLKNPETAAAYKKLSLAAAQVIRKKLGEKLPETKPINARYAALSDYMENRLKEPSGINPTGGIVRNIANAVQNLANPMLQGAYNLTK